MGLDPKQFDTEIVGALTTGNTEALKEWNFRMKRV